VVHQTLGNFQLFREKFLESVPYWKENINVQDFTEMNSEIITKLHVRKPQKWSHKLNWV